MDLFDILQNECAILSSQLQQTAEHYSDWSEDHVFEGTKKGLAKIKEHLKKESLLVNNLKDTAGTEEVLAEESKFQQEILSDIDSIVEIHVDEPGFEQALESIASKVSEHCKFTHEKFFPVLKQHLTPSDIAHVQEQLEQEVA